MKRYIVDTNVLLSHPNLIKTKKAEIYILYSVICELDSKKYELGSIGMASRDVSKYIETLRNQGDLSKGIKNENGGKIICLMDDQNLSTDDSLVDFAIFMKKKKLPTGILSNDLNVRIKAGMVGVESESVEVLESEIKYGGIATYVVADRDINDFYAQGSLPNYLDVPINSYAILKSDTGTGTCVVYSFDGALSRVREKSVFGLKHRNVEQMCAIDALCNLSVPMVSLIGKAGCGKTLLAVASALDIMLTQKKATKIIIIRPPIPVGKDIGFQPGNLQEKMAVWAGSIYDNFAVLITQQSKLNLDMLIENDTIEIIPPAFLRGRSLSNCVVILDEAQSLTRHEIKTIATRIGENCKFIVTGDLEQIDNPRLSGLDNGLSILVQSFKNTEHAICLDLIKTERSTFAGIAAEIL